MPRYRFPDRAAQDLYDRAVAQGVLGLALSVGTLEPSQASARIASLDEDALQTFHEVTRSLGAAERRTSNALEKEDPTESRRARFAAASLGLVTRRVGERLRRIRVRSTGVRAPRARRQPKSRRTSRTTSAGGDDPPPGPGAGLAGVQLSVAVWAPNVSEADAWIDALAQALIAATRGRS